MRIFAAAAMSIALIGVNTAPAVLFALIYVAGATISGTQILRYAGVAQLYSSLCARWDWVGPPVSVA